MAHPNGNKITSEKPLYTRKLNPENSMNYKEVIYTVIPFSEDVCDALIAQLSSIGYEGFEYTPSGFTACISETDFDENRLSALGLLDILPDIYRIEYRTNTLADQNWNQTWEENFSPITIGNRIQVRADYHPSLQEAEYEIIIHPKRSFGSGHHVTTALMLEFILDLKENIKGKKVLDMGCGTGILSIMAAKAGALSVTGIDIDEWAYHNARENLAHNRVKNIQIKIGDASLLQQENHFDLILANINRNILLNDIPRYVLHLNRKGYLILSGFYTGDLPLIREKAEKSGLSYRTQKTNQNWTAVAFYKK